MTIDGSGNVGIGDTAPQDLLEIRQAADAYGGLTISSVEHDRAALSFARSSTATARIYITEPGATHTSAMHFQTSDASGSSPNLVTAMTINSNGDISFGNQGTATPSASVFGLQYHDADSDYAYFKSAANGTGGLTHYAFYNTNGLCGQIYTSSSATTYATSSDYRLKENVDYSWDATTRLKQLKPARFNWIKDDTNTLQDGFLAHEVSSIVPIAVGGTKDGTETLENVVLDTKDVVLHKAVTEAVWTEGKTNGTYPSDSTWKASHTQPVYQDIDHSKLVPLLVKTIQELEARIATLEG